MKFSVLPKLRQGLAAVALLLLTSLSADAEPHFTNKAGNLIWDQATDSVWMRCSLGQNWDGKTCAGKAKEFTFQDAQAAAQELNSRSGFAGHNDWKVPEIRQLASLIACSNGQATSFRDVKDGGSTIVHDCPDGRVKPTIDPIAFPTTDANWS
jgi:hypothetical protein